MGEETQDLKLRAKAEGFEDAAKKVGHLTDAEALLEKQTKKVGEAAAKVAGQIDELADARERLDEQSDGLDQSSKRVQKNWKDTGGVFGQVGLGLAKLALALRSTIFLLKALGSVGAVLKGMAAIRQALKDEIAERMRLAEVMKIQGKVADELQQRTLSQKDAIERIAAGRRQGGFKTPDAARAAQVGARRAQEQFTALTDADVNQVFGLFADQGFSQDELTNLAIIESFGKLNVDADLPDAVLKRVGRRRLRRFQGRVDTFASRETLQGQGRGRGEFRDGQPTERAQRVLGELRAPAGSKEEFIAQMREVLPPETDFEKLAAISKAFSTSGELEAAKVGFGNSARPVTTAINRLQGRVEIELGDQPGFVNQALEALGLSKEFVTLRNEELHALLQFLRRVEKEGGVLPIQKAPDESAKALEKAARSMEEAATALREQADQPRTTILNHPKITYASAKAQREAIRNGQTDLLRRAG